MCLHWQETSSDFYCLQIKLNQRHSVSQTYGLKWILVSQAVFWLCFQCLLCPCLYISLWLPEHTWQAGRSFPTVSFACLQMTPTTVHWLSKAFCYPLVLPIGPLYLGLFKADRKCLITILWPGFCCIPQIVYVLCSAHLSWCYFIPAVSKKMTKIFMYSQLIVTCLWSVLAQKKTNSFSNYK